MLAQKAIHSHEHSTFNKGLGKLNIMCIASTKLQFAKSKIKCVARLQLHETLFLWHEYTHSFSLMLKVT